MPSRSGLAALPLLVLVCLQEGAKPPPPEVVAAARKVAAIAATDHPIPPRSVDVLHYVVRIAVDLATHEIDGSTELTLHPYGGGRRALELDADELAIRGVFDLGDAADPAAAPPKAGADPKPLAHELKGTTLTIDLGRDVPPEQELRLRVDYSAKPRRGLVFVDGAAPMCWSQGECEMNRAWFPCRDFPDDRASSELFVTVADGLRTISNGVLIETLSATAGHHTDHWRMDFPHPAYLTSLVVGPFVESDLGRVADLPLFAYSLESEKESVAAALQPTGRMVELMEKLAGLPYPYPAYRQIAVADFPYDGMENVAATTLAQDDLPSAARLEEKREESEAIVVHELAHQWFGDLVGVTSWADIWLAEGFATFAEPWWIESSQGRDAAAAAWAARQEKAVAHRLTEPRPIVCARYVEPDELFDPTVYESAGCFLQLLRRTVGDAKFLAGVHAWIAREKGKSAASGDFEAIFTEVAGKECEPLFKEWLHAPGVAVVEFSASYDAAQKQLVLSAEQKQAGPGVPEVLHVPVDVAYYVNGARRATRMQLDARVSKATLACDAAPAFVRFNEGGGLFGVLRTQQEPAAWRAALAADQDAAGRAEAAAALARAWPANATDDEATLKEKGLTLAALARALLEEKAPAVRVAAATALGATKHDAARTALCTALWDEAAQVRIAAAGALGRFAGDEVAFGALFSRYGSEERDDVRAECVRQLGAVGVGDIAGALEKLADNERAHPELRGAALVGLAGENLFEKGDAPARARLVARAARLAAAGPSRELRKPAIETLGKLARRSDPDGDAAADALVGLLQDPSLWVKATALEALEEAASPRTLAGLLRFHETAAFPDQKSHARRIIAEVVASLPP